MDVVLPRVSRLSRVFPPLGGKNFSTGLFANQSYDVKGKKEKDTALAYVSEDNLYFLLILMNLYILGFLRKRVTEEFSVPSVDPTSIVWKKRKSF